MSALYQPAQVVKMTGVSLAGIRNYCTRYGAFLSPGATPPKGQPRLFTAQDVRLIAFIRDRTAGGLNHDQIDQALQGGELEEFTDWQIGELEGEEQPQETAGEAAPGAGGGELVASTQLAALEAVLNDYRRREDTLQARIDQAREREERLQGQLQQLQRELGEAQGELKNLKGRRWWERLFTRN